MYVLETTYKRYAPEDDFEFSRDTSKFYMTKEQVDWLIDYQKGLDRVYIIECGRGKYVVMYRQWDVYCPVVLVDNCQLLGD